MLTEMKEAGYMDLMKIGNFITEKRKQKELTQQELADMLHLSNRTISKWECGKGIPDSAIMVELCRVLGISVNELLAGEQLSNDNYKTKAEENVLALINEPDVKQRKALFSFLGNVLAELLIFFFVVFCGYLNVMNGVQVADYMDVPALITVLGSVCIVLVATGLYRDFFNACRISMRSGKDSTTEEVNRALSAVRITMWTALIAGMVLTVVSVVNTFVNITPDNIGALYVALAVGLLGALYALVISLLLLPIMGRLYKIKFSDGEEE